MSQNKMSRRAFLSSAAAVGGIGTFMGPWTHNRVYAQTSAKPIVIGITTDASGQYANSGADERRGILMAIEEVNARGGLLGRKLTHIHVDTETTPATGSRVAERMIQQEKASFLLGAVSSGVANAISQVAQKYGVIYMNTNSSSPTEAGQNCHRVKFVCDGNGSNFAKAAIKNSIGAFGGKFVLLTNDYVWGHDTSRATRKLILEHGGEVIDEILIPQGTRDFTAALVKIQQLKPAIVAATIGGDDQKILRQQIAQLKMGDKPVWLNNQQDWPDVYGLPIDNLFGVFGTNWYHRLPLKGVNEFVARYQAMYPKEHIKVPGNVFYNGYMGARELFSAVERAGSTNNIAIIKALEGHVMSTESRMQDFDAIIDAKTHQIQQTIYLATANSRPLDKDDMFSILAKATPQDVMDTDAAGACKLESYQDTPSFDA